MQRREVFPGWIVFGVCVCWQGSAEPSLQPVYSAPQPDDPASSHVHGSQLANGDRRSEDLIPPFQACVQDGQIFIGYIQQQLAGGDRALADGLRFAMDTDAVCGIVLNLAKLSFRFAPALARQSVLVMEAALAITQAQADRHAECLRLLLASQDALAAARACG